MWGKMIHAGRWGAWGLGDKITCARKGIGGGFVLAENLCWQGGFGERDLCWRVLRGRRKERICTRRGIWGRICAGRDREYVLGGRIWGLRGVNTMLFPRAQYQNEFQHVAPLIYFKALAEVH